MTITIIVILLALLWLLWETDLFTINLMGRFPPLTPLMGLQTLLSIAPLLIMLGYLCGKIPHHLDRQYDCYYRQFKDPVLHRILKLERRGKLVPVGLYEVADLIIRDYQRMESEVELVIEQRGTSCQHP